MKKSKLHQFFIRTAWFDGYFLLPNALGNLIDLCLVTFALNTFSLAVPLVVMQVYDRIIPNAATDTFWWLVGGGSLAILLDSVMRWARAVMNGRMSQQFDHLVGCQVMDRVLNSRLEEYECISIGEQLDRLNAVSTLSNYYVGQVIQTFLDLPFVILLIYVVALLGGQLVLIPLSLIIGYLLLIFIAKHRFSGARRQQADTNDRRFDFVIQVLQGLHLIKAQTVEEQMLRRYERLQASTAEINFKTGFWSRLPAEMGLAFSQLSMFGLIAFGSGFVREGLMTVGGLSACMMLAGRAMQPVQAATQFWLRYSDAGIARERIQKLVKMQPTNLPSQLPFPAKLRGAISLNNVSFRYRENTNWVLDQVNLSVPYGAQIGIVGSSASGTTTLLLVIRGLLKAQSGSALLDHYDINEWNTTDMRGRVEYVSSRGVLFRGSLLDNITMFDNDKNSAGLEAAALAGLNDMVAMLPLGYETRVDNQASNILPMGLIQRICIARALVERPRVLLFDKVDAALDMESERIFLWLLQQLRNRCTVIVVSNRAHILRDMETLYEIKNGKIIELSLEEFDKNLANAAELF